MSNTHPQSQPIVINCDTCLITLVLFVVSLFKFPFFCSVDFCLSSRPVLLRFNKVPSLHMFAKIILTS